MIEADKRKAVFLLHREGMSVREIARRLGISRNTVGAIIDQQGVMPLSSRRDKQRIDPELLRRLYQRCDGHIQRVYEILQEEEGIEVKYSTLTRRMRELEISKPPKLRCDRVADVPGVEMQHDTSPYKVELAGKRTPLIASLLYLRYSKRRYLKFYRAFNRFRMKCFLHEARQFWGYSARQCVIDNTNLARLRGTGKDAVIVPEMEAFAKQYGFRFLCHAVGHANRKAGEERSFWTVETNFFPGRSFPSLEDLNAQALEWSTVRMEHRPQGKAGLIPARAFEHECACLVQLTPHLPAPYRIHDRGTDQYGYVAFEANFYWVPGLGRDEVKVLQYSDRIQIYRARECLIEYPLPPDGVRNQLFQPPGRPGPRRQPHQRRKPTQQEEQRLRAMGEVVNEYLDFALPPKGIRRHRFIRKLFALSARMTASLFLQSVQRALRYRIKSVAVIERIALLGMSQDNPSLPEVEIDESFQHRDAYLEGRLTDLPDFSPYDRMLEQDDG